MRGSTKVLLFLLVVGYVGIKAGGLFKADSDFTAGVERQLNSVGDTSMESIKQDIVRDAEKLGIDVKSEDIVIGYQDTELQTLPQRLVGPAVAQFVNKLASINVHYKLRLLGIPIRQEISTHKIRAVQVLPPVRDPALDEVGGTR